MNPLPHFPRHVPLGAGELLDSFERIFVNSYLFPIMLHDIAADQIVLGLQNLTELEGLLFRTPAGWLLGCSWSNNVRCLVR
jgi:hypothetical protein